MEEPIKKSENQLTFPSDAIPEKVRATFEKGLKPSPSRSLVFENDKQKNIGILKKGITKPGVISFEVLRRAVNAVPVARICVTVLKEKVTKTKWVIKAIDPLKKGDDKRIETITNLLKNPNPNETWRTLLDKMMEDLLVLDSVTVEKTRYPNGELAQLFYVDASTVRPVFDEFGNTDIPLEIKTKDGVEELPVSYVQIFNNSMYGGPESGEIVAAWPKKDLVCFHMHPQGGIDNFGYGLSPMEGVLSVVSNLLNSDNYNGTFFDEGAFPPIILQLAQSLEQRQLEAYREYLYQEISGNFHRPAIMAGGGEMKIHNLKDSTNRDMQFMEYTEWLAKLLAAAFGLAGEDIGITSDLNRATAETQKDLSEAKGYGSVLDLIKEMINNEILYKDFGFMDLEFDWIAEDSTDPDVASKLYDLALKNGSMTLNEVRAKIGEQPYEEWADQPLLLTGEGYKPIHFDSAQETESNADEVADETVYAEDKEITKSANKTLYISRKVKNAEAIIKWAKSNGFSKTLTANDMHVTVAFSRKPVDWGNIKKENNSYSITGGNRTIKQFGDNAVVLTFESSALKARWGEIIGMGASWDYESYTPHVTITYDGLGLDISKIEPYRGPIELASEVIEELNDDWVSTVEEKSMSKSVYTMNNYKTWFDDRGYGQPFIFCNVLTGEGWVIKPPVAVNLFSQDLEIKLTGELSKQGLNVNPVFKMSFNEVVNNIIGTNAEVRMEFDKYINMTPEYDSEKWRAKNGGSRKFPYYVCSKYVDGFGLNSRQIVDDMKRDPTSYSQAIIDIANLWKAEKDMMLGDRRADQYIITPDKRAFGFDYQFQGDKKRWEDSSTAIAKLLIQIPMLYNLFIDKTKEEGKKTLKSIIKNLF